MSERLRVVDVHKRFPGPSPVDAVRGVTLAVEAGEAVVVRGPSGAGKTTLLALLGGLLRPDRGTVVLDGVDLAAEPEPARRAARAAAIGFVFQRGLLLEPLTVHENVALVARALGHDAGPRADALLAALGLAPRRDARPQQLSAGESQRVAVARAMMARPRLVLADEPTAHLDAATGAAVMAALRTAVRAEGAALVLVTHDPRLDAFGDRVLLMEDGRLRGASGG